MAARTSEEEQRRRRRSRLVKGLLLGGAAVGLPALVNVLIARQHRRLRPPLWGTQRRYAWTYGEVCFQALGDGEALVLLHSFGPGHDGEEWRQVAEQLAGGYRVYAPDLPGWGRSDKPKIQYDGELYIQFLGDFLDDVVRDRAVVFASGLSAAYAVQLTADRPELVRALGLVVPSGIDLDGDEPDLKDALIHWLLKLPVLGTSALNLFTSRAALSQHLRRERSVSSARADAASLEHHYRSSHQVGAHLPLAAYLSGYLNHQVEEVLPRLAVPTWLAWGRDATSPPVETADLWLQRIGEAELEVFEGCANLPHAEAAGRFGQRAELFLARAAD